MATIGLPTLPVSQETNQTNSAVKLPTPSDTVAESSVRVPNKPETESLKALQTAIERRENFDNILLKQKDEEIKSIKGWALGGLFGIKKKQLELVNKERFFIAQELKEIKTLKDNLPAILDEHIKKHWGERYTEAGEAQKKRIVEQAAKEFLLHVTRGKEKGTKYLEPGPRRPVEIFDVDDFGQKINQRRLADLTRERKDHLLDQREQTIAIRQGIEKTVSRLDVSRTVLKGVITTACVGTAVALASVAIPATVLGATSVTIFGLVGISTKAALGLTVAAIFGIPVLTHLPDRLFGVGKEASLDAMNDMKSAAKWSFIGGFASAIGIGTGILTRASSLLKKVPGGNWLVEKLINNNILIREIKLTSSYVFKTKLGRWTAPFIRAAAAAYVYTVSNKLYDRFISGEVRSELKVLDALFNPDKERLKTDLDYRKWYVSKLRSASENEKEALIKDPKLLITKVNDLQKERYEHKPKQEQKIRIGDRVLGVRILRNETVYERRRGEIIQEQGASAGEMFFGPDTMKESLEIGVTAGFVSRLPWVGRVLKKEFWKETAKSLSKIAGGNLGVDALSDVRRDSSNRAMLEGTEQPLNMSSAAKAHREHIQHEGGFIDSAIKIGQTVSSSVLNNVTSRDYWRDLGIRTAVMALGVRIFSKNAKFSKGVQKQPAISPEEEVRMLEERIGLTLDKQPIKVTDSMTGWTYFRPGSPQPPAAATPPTPQPMPSTPQPTAPPPSPRKTPPAEPKAKPKIDVAHMGYD